MIPYLTLYAVGAVACLLVISWQERRKLISGSADSLEIFAISAAWPLLVVFILIVGMMNTPKAVAYIFMTPEYIQDYLEERAEKKVRAERQEAQLSLAEGGQVSFTENQ